MGRGTKMKPELRTFKEFPPNKNCPGCGTSEPGECVLLGIDGTEHDNIQEAKPFHLACAVATNYRPDMGLVYRRLQ